MKTFSFLAFLLAVGCGSASADPLPSESGPSTSPAHSPVPCLLPALAAGAGGKGGAVALTTRAPAVIEGRIDVRGGEGGSNVASAPTPREGGRGGHGGSVNLRSESAYTFSTEPVAAGITATVSKLDLEGVVAASSLTLDHLRIEKNASLRVVGVGRITVRELVIEEGGELIFRRSTEPRLVRGGAEDEEKTRSWGEGPDVEIFAARVVVKGTMTLRGADGDRAHPEGWDGGTLLLKAETLELTGTLDLRGGTGVAAEAERPCPEKT